MWFHNFFREINFTKLLSFTTGRFITVLIIWFSILSWSFHHRTSLGGHGHGFRVVDSGQGLLNGLLPDLRMVSFFIFCVTFLSMSWSRFLWCSPFGSRRVFMRRHFGRYFGNSSCCRSNGLGGRTMTCNVEKRYYFSSNILSFFLSTHVVFFCPKKITFFFFWILTHCEMAVVVAVLL